MGTKSEIDALMNHPLFYDSVLDQVDDRCLNDGFIYQLVTACQEDPVKQEKVLRMFASAAAAMREEKEEKVGLTAAGEMTAPKEKKSKGGGWCFRKKKALPIKPLLDDGMNVVLTYEVCTYAYKMPVY